MTDQRGSHLGVVSRIWTMLLFSFFSLSFFLKYLFKSGHNLTFKIKKLKLYSIQYLFGRDIHINKLLHMFGLPE